MLRATFFAIALMALLAPSADAEVIRLLDGRLLQGKIVSHNGVEVVLQRWDTGGQVTIPFKEMLAGDRKRLEVKFNYRSVEDFLVKIKATRLTMKNSIDRPIGVMDATRSTETHIVIHRRGVNYTYDRSRITQIDQVMVAETEVYTPAAIYKRHLAELEGKESPDPREHHELARYVEKLGLYEEAKEHFQKAAELDPTNYELKVKAAVERLTKLIENRDAMIAYRGVVSAKATHKYDAARERLETLKTSYGEIEDIFPKDFESLAAEIEAHEAEYLNRQLMRYLHVTARQLAWELARKPQTTVAEGLAYGRGEMHQELLAKLAAKLKIDEKKAKTVFDNRQTKRTHKLTLGTVTWLIQSGGGGAKGGTKGGSSFGGGGGGRGGRGGGGDGGTINIGGRKINVGQLLGRGGGVLSGGKKQNPADAWWYANDLQARRGLIYAAWALKNLETVKETERACGKCGGQGQVTVYVKKKKPQKTKCPRCQGARVEKTVWVK